MTSSDDVTFQDLEKQNEDDANLTEKDHFQCNQKRRKIKVVKKKKIARKSSINIDEFL